MPLSGSIWYRRWERAADSAALVGRNWFKRWVRRGDDAALVGKQWFRREVAAGDVETGEVPVDVSVSVAAGADDAREVIATTVVTINATTMQINNAARLGFRFTGLSALAGKTIQDAKIQFTAGSSQTGSCPVNIDCENVDTPAQYAATNTDISARTLTGTPVLWTIAANWTANDRGADQLTPNLASIMQTPVNRPGFGGVVNFVMVGTSANARTVAAEEHATQAPATLSVTYVA